MTCWYSTKSTRQEPRELPLGLDFATNLRWELRGKKNHDVSGSEFAHLSREGAVVEQLKVCSVLTLQTWLHGCLYFGV